MRSLIFWVAAEAAPDSRSLIDLYREYATRKDKFTKRLKKEGYKFTNAEIDNVYLNSGVAQTFQKVDRKNRKYRRITSPLFNYFAIKSISWMLDYQHKYTILQQSIF